MNPTRAAEALADLEALLLDPDAFGDTSPADAALALASEFQDDDPTVRRLADLADADTSGDLRRAGRRLREVRRRIADRYGVTPAPSVPVVADARAARLAGSRNGHKTPGRRTP